MKIDLIPCNLMDGDIPIPNLSILLRQAWLIRGSRIVYWCNIGVDGPRVWKDLQKPEAPPLKVLRVLVIVVDLDPNPRESLGSVRFYRLPPYRTQYFVNGNI